MKIISGRNAAFDHTTTDTGRNHGQKRIRNTARRLDLTIDGADLAAKRLSKADPHAYFQVRRGRAPTSETSNYRETAPLWFYSNRKKFDAAKRGLPEAL